ncbi:MAG TPA: hypothetical protein VIY54_08415 [Steroidobacteraceae bacterium]
MDVYALHQSLHTWKDFWIHLGTITAGLLIALGLEASAQRLHHLHQRHQLEAALHEEAETAQYYARLYIQVERLRELATQLFETTEARVDYAAAFASAARPDVPDIVGMTHAELVAYTLLVEKNLSATRNLRQRYLMARAATAAILRGVTSDDEVVAAEMAAVRSSAEHTP